MSKIAIRQMKITVSILHSMSCENILFIQILLSLRKLGNSSQFEEILLMEELHSGNMLVIVFTEFIHGLTQIARERRILSSS